MTRKQQRSAKLFEQIREHCEHEEALLKTLLEMLLVHHLHTAQDFETILNVIIRALVFLAGHAQVSGGSVLRRVAHEMDMICASDQWADEFAEWFERDVPPELMKYVDFEMYPDDKSPYPEEEE